MSTTHVQIIQKPITVRISKPTLMVQMPGTQGPAGSPIGTWRGAYNPLTTYGPFSVVEYNGSTYVSKQDTTGNLPTNATYWELMASK